MTIREMARLTMARVCAGEELLEEQVDSAFSSDMMSDVLAYAKDQPVLLTGLNNPQAVRTALMLDMRCVIFVRGKDPAEAVVGSGPAKRHCVAGNTLDHVRGRRAAVCRRAPQISP